MCKNVFCIMGQRSYFLPNSIVIKTIQKYLDEIWWFAKQYRDFLSVKWGKTWILEVDIYFDLTWSLFILKLNKIKSNSINEFQDNKTTILQDIWLCGIAFLTHITHVQTQPEDHRDKYYDCFPVWLTLLYVTKIFVWFQSIWGIRG